MSVAWKNVFSLSIKKVDASLDTSTYILRCIAISSAVSFLFFQGVLRVPVFLYVPDEATIPYEKA